MSKLSRFTLSTLLTFIFILTLAPDSKAGGGGGGATDGVLARSLSSTTMDVRWGPVTGVESWKIYVSTDDVTYNWLADIADPNTRYYQHTGLSASTHYYYQVETIIGGVSDGMSVTEPGTHSDTQPPRAPVNLHADPGDQQVTLTWSVPPEPNIATYNVYRVEHSGDTPVQIAADVVVADPAGTGWVDDDGGSGLTNYVDYFYRVEAKDTNGGVGLQSPEEWGRPVMPVPPIAPEEIPHQPQAICGTCHDPHSNDRQDFMLIQSPEQENCYQCHDDGTGLKSNFTTYLEYAEFGVQYLSRHFVPTTVDPPVAPATYSYDCNNCHFAHIEGGDYASYPRLLDIYNNASCLTDTDTVNGCHGPLQATLGNLESGDMTYFNTSAHGANLPVPDSDTGIQCINCHRPHSSPNDSLRTYKEENACLQCHITGNSYGAKDIYTKLYWNPESDTHHDILDSDQAANGTQIECTNCHNAHSATTAQQHVGPHDPSPSNPWTGTMYDFCVECHDNVFPSAAETAPFATEVIGPAVPMTNIADTFLDPSGDAHGFRDGSPRLFDNFMGYPDPATNNVIVSCEICHDPHGTPNNHNLKYEITSLDGLTTRTGLLTYKIADGSYDLRYFCEACHPDHMGFGKKWPNNCTNGSCHQHGTGTF